MKRHIIPLFFLILGTFFLIRSCVHGVELEDEYLYMYYTKKTHYQNLKPDSPTPQNRAEWKKRKEFHIENGLRTYNDAKNRCWFTPNLDDREKARYCFTAVASSLGNTSWQAKAATSVLTLFVQYGLDAMEEWNYIQEKLHWAEYHFDLAAFYDNLLSKE